VLDWTGTRWDYTNIHHNSSSLWNFELFRPILFQDGQKFPSTTLYWQKVIEIIISGSQGENLVSRHIVPGQHSKQAGAELCQAQVKLG
jgi:hypothetical protein